MNFSKLAVAVFMIAGATTAAGAADLGRGGNSDQTIAVFDTSDAHFRGFRFGVQGGWGSYNHDLTGVETYKTEAGTESYTLFDASSAGAGGGLIGVTTGYDFQVGRFVFGPFAEYNWSNASFDLKAFDGDFSAKLRHDNEWSVGGRVGFTPSASTLVYGLAAFTSADTTISTSDEIEGLKDGQNFHGYTLGVGVETFLSRDVSAKVEGRWTQYNKATLYDDIKDSEGFTVKSEPSAYVIMLGLNYHPRFGDYASLK